MQIGCAGYTAVGGGPEAHTAEGEESKGCKYRGKNSPYSTTEASLEAKLGPENSADAPKGLGVYQHQTTVRTSFEEKQPRQLLVLLDWVTLRSSPGHPAFGKRYWTWGSVVAPYTATAFTAIKFHFHETSSAIVNQH